MRKSVLTKKIDNSIYFKVFVALLWAKGILPEYIRGAMLKIPGFSLVADYLIPLIMIIGFFLSYKTITDRIRGSDLVFITVCLFVYGLEFWLFSRNRPYFQILYPNFIIGCLPFYFVGVALRGDDKELVRWMYRISCASIIAFAFYMLFVNQMGDVALRGGDMSSAYNLLPHACLSFYFLMSNFKLRRLLLFLVAAICLVLMGTRGAVLCLLVFMVVTIIATIRTQKPLVILAMIMLCLFLLLFGSLTDLLIQWAYIIADKFGLSTRIFDKMLSGNITASTGRIAIRQRIFYYLREYNLVGLGIYGDLYISEGMYAHNLALELWAHFGYYIGSIIFIAFLVFICSGVVYCIKIKDENAQIIMFLLLCCCVKLLMSSSYLREPFLWVMLGYVAALLREKRAAATEAQRQGMQKSKYIKYTT